MPTSKYSTTLNPDHVREAKARVGERGFSRYLDEALARALQHDRLADLEDELAERHGAIPEEVQRAVDALPWPR
jgi:hypothetical protein